MSGKRSKSESGKGGSDVATFADRREAGATTTGSSANIPTSTTISIVNTAAVASINNSSVAASATNAVAVATSDALGMTNEANGAPRTAAVVTNYSKDPVQSGNPLPTLQVNVDVANKVNAIKKGTIPKQVASTAKSIVNSVTNIRGKVVVRRNPVRKARADRYTSCEWCSDRNNSRMVQCDGCGRWFHFECVEVTEGIAEISWFCPVCPSLRSSVEQETPAGTTHATVQVDNPLPKDSGDAKSCGKKSSKRSEQRKKDLRLQKLEEQKKLEQKFLDEKYKIMEEHDSDCATDLDDEDLEKMSKVSQWVKDTEQVGAGQDSGVVAEELQEECEVPACNVQPAVVDRQCSQRGLRNTLADFAPVQRSTPQARPTLAPNHQTSDTNNMPPMPRSRLQLPPRPSPPMIPVLENQPIPAEETICVLNRSQLAARQAVPKDLPEFAGNPEDWPLFFSMYTSSTQMCGFSNEENMLRLRKCLKGKALEAVRCRLLHPSNVTGVLATLKMLYGRPETIVQATISKIRCLPSPDIDRLESLVNFALTVENLVATIEACGVQDFMYNASLKFELVDRLPPTLRLDWAKYTRGNLAPNLADFSKWLYSMAEDASAVMSASTNALRSRSSKKDAFINVHSETANDRSGAPANQIKDTRDQGREAPKDCFACKGTCPSLAKCKRFTELSYDSKWAVIREAKLCRKCLRKHNGTCRQQNKCGINGCIYLHHPLLHSEKTDASRRFSQAEAATGTSCNVHQAQTNDVLFRIVPVVLYGPSKMVETYAFIDDGSELTLMEHSLAQELGLQGSQKTLCLKWTGGASRMENESLKVDMAISSVRNTSQKYQLADVRTIQELRLRPQTLVASELQNRYKHLAGIPFDSYTEVSPRILIGLDNAQLGHAFKSREGKPSEPIAVKSRLGWIVYGNCSSNQHLGSHVSYHAVQVCECNEGSDESLHAAMKSYFTLDSMGISKPDKPLLSVEDQRAMEILEAVTTRKGGRFETGLLFKYEAVRLPDSKAMARKRWECLERRMEKDEVLTSALRAKMVEYVQKGYVRKLTEAELKIRRPREWYLPVFPVYNPNKPGKLRLVWDAAATVQGISLNSVLLKGPDQLVSLLSVLIQFREFRVAVCGDLREMFHQVSMRLEDQYCQLFYWKETSTKGMPDVYIMQVMTFGACCSPATAQYVKNTNAKLFEHEYPQAVDAIVNKHYVDDMLASVETEEEAVRLAHDVKRIHAVGGFEMRNWLSNSTTVLASLQEEATNEKNLGVGEENTTEKILGLWWNTTTDCFTFKISPRYDQDLLSGSRRPTKREVLRTLMMMFDPLGFISHFLMYLKVLLQEIWRTSVEWDTPIEEPQFQKWLMWLKVLPEVTNVQIPRCYRLSTSLGSNVQMHTFVDASESGFAAIVYLRFEEGDLVETALVSTKTRVAPLKFLSIPRSELQASILGVRLANSVAQSLSTKISERYFWTDSRDVLCWINSDHRRYSPFVAFRVSEILETTDAKQWRWVPTKQNVADEGTKWTRHPDLNPSSRWFQGPEFLRKCKADWPATPRYGATDTELRAHLLTHAPATELVIDPQNFSTWTTMLRSTAYVFRYICNSKQMISTNQRKGGPLTQQELIRAETFLHRLAQQSEYADEIAILYGNRLSGTEVKSIPKSSSIAYFCPFLDEKDQLRVRGRTGACPSIDYDAANPIILPGKHRITRLILLYYHRKYHHQNHNTVLNEVRQRYRIPRLKSVYNTIRKQCQKCMNEVATPRPPAMSDLPPARLAAYSRPFTHMGVDYFGPILVSANRKTEKRWVLIATCLTIRAIHLQIAHTLSTDSCVLALRNVIGRRGTPAVIYSDQGTNFRGASKELKAALESLDRERLMTEFTTTHTSWSFNPPASPHMGGAWERLIRTVKQNLCKLLSNRPISYEILENALIEVESIINSRPLTSIPLEDDDSPVLTPNDFLLGSSSGLKPWVHLDDNPTMLRNCWRLSQALANQFWKQWIRDYLPSITRRTKWLEPAKPIKTGDIVIIADPNLPRNCWPKGRVIATKPGVDGQVRWATIQTVSGIYERPAVKLAVLDVGVCQHTPQDDHRRIPGGNVDPATSNDPPSPNAPIATNAHASTQLHPCPNEGIVDGANGQTKVTKAEKRQ
ncbi:uncharacterized protein LOC128740530 [Sabethes cyaneus]|uniref:uncharacterized protein LOC128740530 n=1 Tax=Sabethes cyaneus TaxID=53552 RepID=UPI00237DF6EB|nr:uncharacterized protein LOC128740530 [Sabethes cyaneus]